LSNENPTTGGAASEASGEALNSIDATMRWLASFHARSWRERAAFGAVAALFAALERLALQDQLGDRVAYVTFYPAVGIAALVGGLVSGIVAAALSALVAHLWIATLISVGDWVALITFLTSGVFVSGVAELLHRVWIRLGGAERERAEAEQLRVANETFRLAITAGDIGAWDFDVEADVSEDRAHMREIFGLSPNTVLNPAAVFALILPEDLPSVEAAMRAARDPAGDGLYSADYRIHRANDGAERWIAARARTYFHAGRPIRMIGICRDVTSEKTWGFALLEKAALAERLASVSAAIPGFIFSVRIARDGENSCLYASPNVYDVCGLAPEEIAGDLRPFFRRVHAEDHVRVRGDIERSARAGAIWRGEFRYFHPEKGDVWLEAHATPIREAGGDLVWHGYASDVTKRVAADRALMDSEARLRAVLDGAKDAVISIDERGVVQSINAAGLRMFAYDRNEIVGRNVAMLMPADIADRHDASLENFLLTGEAKVIGVGRETTARRKDGAQFPIDLTVIEAKYERGRLFVGFLRDLSERHKIRARIDELQEQRLSAIGGLAASMAHELNQPLAAAENYIASALRLQRMPERERPTSAEQSLEFASDQLMRCGQILRRLREFVARGEPNKTIESLHALIEEVSASAFEPLGMERVRLELRLDASQDCVLMDKVQIGQVLFNLIRNAKEAMNGVGDPWVKISTTAMEGDFVRVDVADGGPGISPRVKDDLFEPFLTTKSNGTGIGLSISRSIVEAHDGKLWAGTDSGGGAVLSFSLPSVELEADE